MNGSRFCSHFNTSNVTIQQIVQLLDLAFNLISIHLMLLFNEKGRKYLEDCYRNFNTSNVTIQPYRNTHSFKIFYISIHLMLLFNGKIDVEDEEEGLFQYI